MEIIGQINESLLICVNNSSLTSLTLAYNSDSDSGASDSFRQLFLLNLAESNTETCSKSVKSQHVQPFVFLPVPSTNSHIIHASLQKLQPANESQATATATATVLSAADFYPTCGAIAMHSLMTVVYHRLKQEPDDSSNSYYSIVLFLLETNGEGNAHTHAPAKSSSSNSSKTIIIEKFQLVQEQRLKLHAHVLPCNFEPSVASNLLTPASSTGDLTNVCQRYLNRVIVLHLQEGFTIFKIETTPVSSREDVTAMVRICNRIELLSSECVPKPFWWAQWNPDHQFLAFTHRQKLRQSPSMEYPGELRTGAGTGNETRKRVLDAGTLSVYQLHSSYPRESVLNFPLPKYEEEILSSKQEFFKPTCALEFNPFVLASAPPTPQQQLRVLANGVGTAYVFQLLPTASSSSGPTTDADINPAPVRDSYFVKYIVHILHHNKSLSGTVTCQPNMVHGAYHIRVDVCLIANGQFMVIVAWPLFVHILDVGSDHEPSHHLLFNASSLLSFAPAAIKEPSVISLAMINPVLRVPDMDKTTQTEQAFRIVYAISNVNNSMQVQNVELNSAFILPLLKQSDVQFQLSALHFLMIHASDTNAVKRMIYNAGQSTENVWLAKLFQEFLVSHSYALTRKQLMPNLKQFLHLLPYCPATSTKDCYENMNCNLELKPILVQVSTMLLSPNQRIFPHTVTDLWTVLWELSDFLSKNKRFSHKTIADKLLISLQCYKPEVLSRATTPMSPSSPMIWSAAGPLLSAATGGGNGSGASGTSIDLTSPFGVTKRGQELQLPFLEHESCTANKQEYIYSINLRELSMHLLKERKDCPVHGHSVGGRYVNSLVETSRLLCHLICLMAHLAAPSTKSKAKDKGFRLIDSLNGDTKLRLFILLEHYSLAIAKLACPLPNGFTSFFAYLGYRVLQYDQFLWHVRTGTFDLQIDLIKMIMADMNDSQKSNVEKKLHLISLLSKSRAGRVLNSWNHPKSICIRARQHSADLLAGNVVSNARRTSNLFNIHSRKYKGGESQSKTEKGPLGTFFTLLAAKANPSDIDLALLTEATMLSMKMDD